MTDYYVDDDGDNSDGLTWAKAFTSLAGAVGASPGDRVFISSDHVETASGSSLTIEFANTNSGTAPICIISADKTSGEPPSTFQTMAAGGETSRGRLANRAPKSTV